MKRILRSLFGAIICITISIIVFTYNVKAGVCGSDDDGFICCNSFHTFGHGNYLSTYDDKKIGPRFISVDTNFAVLSYKILNLHFLII